ncbi:rhodanese-like domain-containing protein [Hymenobacter terrenus]|uniref:rhodanese-like domain-containing protein n=1 Tax=Hymenobacter terrenus TaxID=1629124 RepID=UPI0006196800|nr:rhodanese-like domain-containing protein [Hymenobacter terrenus]
MNIKSLILGFGLSLVAAVAAPAQTPAKPQGAIAVAQFAAQLQAQPKPQLIDARSPEEFALNHVPAAVNFNLTSPDYAARLPALNPTKPVFVYSIGNGRSVALAADLRKRGFAEVYVLDGGIGAWTGSGQPLFTTAQRELTSAQYQAILAQNDLVLVDVGSKYCGACKKVKPILETLRKEHGTALKIVELELEENAALISSLKTVTSFPYLILYRQGQVVLKHEGLTNLKTDLDTKLVAAK